MAVAQILTIFTFLFVTFVILVTKIRLGWRNKGKERANGGG